MRAAKVYAIRDRKARIPHLMAGLFGIVLVHAVFVAAALVIVTANQ